MNKIHLDPDKEPLITDARGSDVNIVCREGGGKTEEKTDSDSRQELLSVQERTVICIQCGNRVAYPDDLIRPGDADYSLFQNPAGIFFRVVCFRKAEGCTADSDYTDFNSWFPGCLWSIALCSRCCTHLGWHYISENRSFWGLIADRLSGI